MEDSGITCSFEQVKCQHVQFKAILELYKVLVSLLRTKNVKIATFHFKE